MDAEQKRWFEQNGTAQEREFVARYGDRKVSATSLLTSVLFMLGMAAGFFVLVGGYLYLSRSSAWRPVTGKWVGTLSSGNAATDRRAVYLDTSVSPLHIFTPALTGTVRMCSPGDTAYEIRQTRTVSPDTIGIIVASTTTDEHGEIFGALRGNSLTTQYDGTPAGLDGDLRRGSLDDYHRACNQLQH